MRRILWTGGFDSTWLMVDALLAGHVVEAVTWRGYGMQPGWHKVDEEDAARRRITAWLPTSLRRRLAQRVEADPAMETAARVFKQELAHVSPDGWSPQVQILAALPRLTGGPVEAAFVAGDGTLHRPEARAMLEREGLSMPLIRLTKNELADDALSRGFAELLAMTWSCEGVAGEPPPPTHRPCGRCDPCRHRILPLA